MMSETIDGAQIRAAQERLAEWADGEMPTKFASSQLRADARAVLAALERAEQVANEAIKMMEGSGMKGIAKKWRVALSVKANN